MNSKRLTMRQVSVFLNTPIGRLRADPTFPPMHQGTFDEAAVLAWQQARDAKPDAKEKSI
jgi:hypothetical protein